MRDNTVEDELAEVHTGNGYHADLEATQSKRIMLTVQHLKQLDLHMAKLIREQKLSVRATNQLVKVTKIQGEENKTLQSRVYWLTWATVVLALVQVLVAIYR